MSSTREPSPRILLATSSLVRLRCVRQCMAGNVSNLRTRKHPAAYNSLHLNVSYNTASCINQVTNVLKSTGGRVSTEIIRDPLLNLTKANNKLPVHYHERSGRSSCAPCVLRKLHCLWQSNFFKAIGRLRVAAIHVFQMPVVLSNMKASKPLLQRQSSMCFGQMYGRPRSDQEDVRRVHYQREHNRKVALPLKPLLRINIHWDICIANPVAIYIP